MRHRNRDDVNGRKNRPRLVERQQGSHLRRALGEIVLKQPEFQAFHLMIEKNTRSARNARHFAQALVEGAVTMSTAVAANNVGKAPSAGDCERKSATRRLN